MTVRILTGDCRALLPTLDADSVDAVVCDPPYHLTTGKKGGSGDASVNLDSPYGRSRIGTGFMGKKWDGGDVAFRPETWAAVLRVAKPGAHLVAFGGTRTHHRLMCAIEDAGWEIRDCLSYLYGGGFPKSLNLDKTGVFCACDVAVRGVRKAGDQATESRQESEADGLLVPVQRGVSGSGVESARPQGACGMESGDGCGVSGEDQGGRQRGLEGRGDVPQSEGELRTGEVRASAGVGASDGEEGRVHHGAPPRDGDDLRSPAQPDGGGASHRPRPAEQRAVESRALAGQSEPQARGAWPVCGGCRKPRIPGGLGTALKPAWEPIILARKPFTGTVAANVAAHGAGALNIDGCRVGTTKAVPASNSNAPNRVYGRESIRDENRGGMDPNIGRWPANVVLDEDAAALLDEQSGTLTSGANPTRRGSNKFASTYGEFVGQPECEPARGVDVGGASRFYYCAKASRAEREAGLHGFERKQGVTIGQAKNNGSGGLRNGTGLPTPTRNHHPTVKPLALMRWLVRLVTPRGGTVLDPFAGSGSTGCAAELEGFDSLLIEREPEYVEIIRARVAHCASLYQPDLSPAVGE